MKNEGLIHHRPSKVQGDEEDMKGLAGIGFFVFFTTIAVWPAARTRPCGF